MKNPEISALAEDVAEIVPNRVQLPKQNNTGLIKFFIIAFILLLIYLLSNKFLFGKSVVVGDGGLNVIGIYYGAVNSKSPDEVIVNLGKYNELKSGIIETKPIKVESEPMPKPPVPQLTKNQLIAKIAINTEFAKVVASIGKPDKTLDITEQQKDSGFKMYLWHASPRIVCVFYKNKLISKL
jgi:hypothetical protein